MNETYYDFNSANDFLQTLSDGLGDLSPTSLSSNDNQIVDGGGESWGFGDAPDNLMSNDLEDKVGIMGDAFVQDDETGGLNEGLAGQVVNSYGQDFEQSNALMQPISMSSESYSQESSNGVSPNSNHSISSTRTSPEPSIKLETDDKKLIPKSALNNKKICKPGKKDKRSHNMIEKKYRTNINSKILALRDAVPSLRIATGNKDVSIADLEGLTPASKLNKASVLTKATEYIKHLENKNKILQDQNRQLQVLIQEASLNATSKPVSGFGQVPSFDQRSYNVTPATQYPQGQGDFTFSNPNYDMSTNNEVRSGLNINKYLMGGLATIVGTSLIAGDGSDFKGMSAMPFSFLFPFNSSSSVAQTWMLIKILILVVSVANLVIPIIFRSNNSAKQKISFSSNIWTNWLLGNLGLQLPHIVDLDSKKKILCALMGKGNGSTIELLKIYVFLSTSEPCFENCILQLIAGTLLARRVPLVSTFINHNMSLKGYLILNLDYTGDDASIILLNKLIKNIEGLAFLGSDEIMSRLQNVYLGRPINAGCSDNENFINYASCFHQYSHDFYGLLFGWRIIQISSELIVTKLVSLTEKDADEVAYSALSSQLCDDCESILEVLSECGDSFIVRYFSSIKAVISPSKYSIELMNLLQYELQNCMNELNQDDELSEFSSDEDLEINNDRKIDLISSLNIISKEEFLVLLCSLILYYHDKDKERACELLKYFKGHSQRLSLLSFAAIIVLLDNLVTKDNTIDDGASQELNELIISTRLWINEHSCKIVDNKTRAQLSDFVVDKAKLLINSRGDEE